MPDPEAVKLLAKVLLVLAVLAMLGFAFLWLTVGKPHFPEQED